MEVGGQRYAPAALSPGKTRYPLYRRLGGPQGRSGRVPKVSPLLGFNSRTVQPVASRYTDWAILTLNYMVNVCNLKTDNTHSYVLQCCLCSNANKRTNTHLCQRQVIHAVCYHSTSLNHRFNYSSSYTQESSLPYPQHSANCPCSQPHEPSP